MTNLIDVPRGLKGVAAAETRIGDVRGSEGFRVSALEGDEARAIKAVGSDDIRRPITIKIRRG